MCLNVIFVMFDNVRDRSKYAADHTGSDANHHKDGVYVNGRHACDHSCTQRVTIVHRMTINLRNKWSKDKETRRKVSLSVYCDMFCFIFQFIVNHSSIQRGEMC